MARSSLLGIDPAPTEAPGRDKDLLGPSDSSDTGSDVAGLDLDDDPADPGLPTDVALRDDQAAPLTLGESLAMTEGDDGVRDGADIGVDQVFTLDGAQDDPAVAIDALGEATVDDDAEDAEEAGEEDDIESEVDENDTASRSDLRRRAAGQAADATSAHDDVPGGPDAAGRRPGRD